VSANPLPTGDDARRLELVHLFVTAPLRLNAARRGPPGQTPARAAVGGVSCNTKGWLVSWVAYVESTADVPAFSVYPAMQRGVSFDLMLPATAEVEVLARVDTPERAVGRLSHQLHSLTMVRIDPDMDYLGRAVAAYRGELRRQRDQATAERAAADEA
jgi:hypothetical protein